MSRKNVHLSESVENKAKALIDAEVADGLSDLIAELIRAEFDRRFGVKLTLPIEHLNDAGAKRATAPAAFTDDLVGSPGPNENRTADPAASSGRGKVAQNLADSIRHKKTG